METEWIHRTIRDRLVVRVDLVRFGRSGYKSIHTAVIGGREDEDGLDPVSFSCEMDASEAAQAFDAHLEWLALCGWDEARLHAFIDAARSDWHEEWEVEEEIVVRSRPWSLSTEDTAWRIEPPGSELRLQALVNLQGMISFHVMQHMFDADKPPFEGNWCLIGLISRMRGLVDGEFAALRQTTKGS